MSTDTAPKFDAEAIGKATDPVEFDVERERIAAYAAATNDPIEPHASGELASPVFSIVPAFASLGSAAFGVTPPELIGAIVHGEHDFRFHKPITPGMKLTTTSAPIGLRQRSSGVVVVTRGETVDGDGDLVTEQYMTTFVRGATGASDAGETAAGHAFDDSLRERDPDATVEQTYDSDQTYRYAEASGDPMQIHLDDEFAKSVGLPGIIIHGMCSMAFTAVGLIQNFCPDDPTRVKRLAVRFSGLALPEQTITTTYWRNGQRDGREVIAYETVSDAGVTVIKDGLAEIA